MATKKVAKEQVESTAEIFEPEKKKGPEFPRIGERFEVLMGTDRADLVKWVERLPLYSGVMSVEPRKQALVAAILITEFGTKAYIDFRLNDDRER